MSYIREEALTPSEAKKLEHMGFWLMLVKLGAGRKDLYKVFAK